MYRFIHNGIIYNILINTFFNDNEKCMEISHFTIFSNDDLTSNIQVLGKHLSEEAMKDV